MPSRSLLNSSLILVKYCRSVVTDVREIQELRKRQYGVSADSLASGKTLVVEDKGPVSPLLGVKFQCLLRKMRVKYSSILSWKFFTYTFTM